MEEQKNEFIKPGENSQMRIILVALFFLCFVLIIIASIVISTGIFKPVVFSDERAFTIAQGSTTARVAQQLKESNIVRNAFLFRALITLLYPNRTVKAGEYVVTGPMNMIEVATRVVEGMPRKELSIRFTEGWTIANIAEYLDGLGIVKKQDFLASTLKDYRSRAPFLSQYGTPLSLEGYMFPDTYRIYEDSSASDIIEKTLENFGRQYTPDMQESTRKQSRTIHEIVTLASILEREVQSTTDRRKVADIFNRRIKAGMPLQADSTVNYITGKSDPQARIQDLAIDSAYNTYMRKGLPPGPIGNPGRDALQAALAPLENPFWFFLTTSQGDVIYSRTFDEHVKNKIRYLSKKK